MFTLNDTGAKRTQVVNSAVAANANCVVTLDAVAGNYHTLDYIAGGYYKNPAANSTLIVHDVTNNANLFHTPVLAGGPFMFPFPSGLQAPAGAAITVTLLEGNAIKSLSVQYR